MKNPLSILLLLVFSNFFCLYGQGLTPSTARQIFSLEKGDSLEYKIVRNEVSPGCGSICNIYTLNIVESVYYSSSQDTLFIAFHSEFLHGDTFAISPTCDQCDPAFGVDDHFVLNSGLWVVTNLDSSVEQLLDTVYSKDFVHFDSVFSDPAIYGGSRQDSLSIAEHILSDFTETYADSLGIVHKTEFDQTATNNTEQLIYYHKVSGNTWGKPYINTGITNLIDQYDLMVYPNPSDGKFTIRSSSYQNIHFNLYNVLGEKVMDAILTGQETEVNKNNPDAGIYYWQVTNENTVVKTGKLVLE